mgnify:CR=1 FL=1
MGFEVYDSGSAFYVWARIPEGFEDAMQLNEILIDRAGVAGCRGAPLLMAIDGTTTCDSASRAKMVMLQSAFDKLQSAVEASGREAKV